MNGTEAPLAQYAFRRSVLEGPRTYSLFRDRITVEDEGHAPRGYLLSEVERVQLKYEHTKQRGYYQCFIRMGRRTIALQHLSWKGFGDFEDRRADYTPFVRALLTQLASQPNVQFRAGSPANFIGAIAGVPIMAALGLVALHFGRSGSAALAGLMMTICLVMIGPSRPRRFDPVAPPADVLPE